MGNTTHKGKVTFVNHEKKYLSIEYTQNGKVKSINFQTGAVDKVPLAKGKPHKFRIGDELDFEIGLTPRGDRMTALNLRFLYNTALERLVNRAATHNAFKGYMKLVDDAWYVKELESYLFFPLQLGKWQVLPENEEVVFELTNLDKPNSIGAALQQGNFIPEYKTAMRHFKNKTPIEAVVSKISPYAIYVDVVGEKVQAKLPVEGNEGIRLGDTLKVAISYLSPTKIAVGKLGGE